MLQAVIFDMDGVIIDSEPLHFEVDMLVMNNLGVMITQADLEPYVGMTNPAMWEQLIQKYALKHSFEELIHEQIDTKLRMLGEREEQPIAGVRELLHRLQGNGTRIGLASSSPRIFIEAVLEKFGIASYFEAVVSGEEVPHGKPAPDVFLAAARELSVDPANCWVIEDSRNGIKAAKTAGMSCVGYVNPNSGNQDLTQADLIVDSLTDLTIESMK